MVGWHHQLDGHEFEQEKKQEFQKNIYFCFMDMPKPLTMKITTNCGKFLQMETPDHLTCLLRKLYEGQEAAEPDMKQQTGSKLGKEYIKGVYCHSAHLTYI